MNTYLLRASLRNLLALLGSALCCASPAAAQNVIRGTVPGWPGNSAYYAPQNVYQYAGAPVAQPVVQVQAGYAPRPTYATYYAPAATSRIAYAVPAMGSYQVSYPGVNQPGIGTTAYYGGYSAPVQRVVYMPQQVYYRQPVAVAAPVTYYRVYQPAPVAVVPQNCNYAATTCQQTSSCGSSSSCWRPFAWLWGNSCTSNSCYKAPQTCYSGCGAPAAVPYYTTPTIPTVVAPPMTAPPPLSPFGRGAISPSGNIAPPPTRTPGSTTIGPGSTFTSPADSTPRIPAGTVIPSSPPAGSFPSTAPPSSTFPGGGAPSGAPFEPGRFRPVIEDPYSQPAAPTTNTPLMMTPPATHPASPLAPVIGSGYRAESPATFDRTNLNAPTNRPNVINQPSLMTPPASVQPLSDPHGSERREPNRAPQLLSPSDRTATANPRWAVVPAVWPVRAQQVQPTAPAPTVPVAQPVQLDDSGWKSAR